MQPAWIALGVLILSLGASVGISLHLGRRRFYRTNAHGVEEFGSYRRAVRSDLYEGLLKLLQLVLWVSTLIAWFVVGMAPSRYW